MVLSSTILELRTSWNGGFLLQRVLDEMDYLNPFQSGFATEKALVAVMDDLKEEVVFDEGGVYPCWSR